MAQRVAAVDDEGRFFGLVAEQLSATYPAPLAKPDAGPAAPLTYRNVDDFGAVGDATTDDRAAVQAALDDAGDGGVVRLSPFKRYRIAGTLTMRMWQRLEGMTSAFAAEPTSPAELVFDVSGSTPGIRVRSYGHLANLVIRGPGDAVGTCVGVQMFDATSNAISLEDVSINDWAVGAHLDQVYYGKLIRAGFRRNAVGLKITSSLNITLFRPEINAKRADGSPGSGIQGGARPLTIFGGSLEQCRAFLTLTHNETLNLHGVYFETTIGSGLTDITGVQLGGYNNVTVNAYGCYVYLPFMSSWIDSRTSTGLALNARGNTFIAGPTVESPAGAVVYRVTAGQSLDIGGDSWIRVEKAGITYLTAVGGAVPLRGARIAMPVGHAQGTVTYDGRLTVYPVQAVTVNDATPVAIDLTYPRAVITLNANLASVSFSGTPIEGQTIEVTYLQDATGGRTYMYPSQTRFAGGVAPNTTTPATRTTVTFRYNAFLNRWHEISRVVAVPNS